MKRILNWYNIEHILYVLAAIILFIIAYIMWR
jgi:hypothetical protein